MLSTAVSVYKCFYMRVYKNPKIANCFSDTNHKLITTDVVGGETIL